MLRYEDRFSLKECSGESVEEKVVGNVKENFGIQNLFWNLMTSSCKNWNFPKNLSFSLALWIWNFFFPYIHQENFSAVVARLLSIPGFPSSRPAETTFSFLSFTKKWFLVSQLDVVRFEKLRCPKKHFDEYIKKMQTNTLEHFLSSLNTQKCVCLL